MPVRTAYLNRAAQGNRYANKLEDFQMTFECTDNSTGTRAGSTTPGFWSIYNGRVLLDDCNVLFGDTNVISHPIRLYRLDSQTGLFEQESSWDFAKRGQRKGFLARTRAEIEQLRDLLYALRGRQKAFWIPTFIEDITIKASVSALGTQADIERNEYVRHARQREQRNLVRITLTSGTQFVREITNSTLVDSTTERLTFDQQWGTDLDPEDFARIEFYELVRFDTDRFNLNYNQIGQVELAVPVKTVFDDVS